MNISCFIFGVIFLICGAIFFMGKFHIFIPSWKNMTQEEKDAIPMHVLGHNIGTIISLCGLIFIINGIFEKYNRHFFIPSMVIWLVIAGIDVFYIGKSKKYNS